MFDKKPKKTCKIWITRKGTYYSGQYLVSEMQEKEKAIENAKSIKLALEYAGFPAMDVKVEEEI